MKSIHLTIREGCSVQVPASLVLMPPTPLRGPWISALLVEQQHKTNKNVTIGSRQKVHPERLVGPTQNALD